MEYDLACTGCGEVYRRRYPSQVCGRCNGILEVRYNAAGKAGHALASFWDYENVLPKGRYKHYEVGMTRIIRSHGNANLFFKLETDNPTRSFKDRGSVIEVAKAKEYGYDELVCASTGNMAYSIAYYSKLYGMRVKVFISGNANIDKMRDIRGVGDADITKVRGDFSAAQERASEYAKRRNVFLSGDYCYRKEGQSTVAYEIMAQARNATHIIVPVGNATLISGILKGLGRMEESGELRTMPKVIAVQSTGCMPFVRAFKKGRKIKYEEPKTDADAIAVGMPTFGEQAILGLKEHGGCAVAVSDREMKKAQESFYRDYGIVAEMGGAASIAAARQLRFKEDDLAVAVVSGGNV